MNIYHTSPVLINKIDKDVFRLFEDCLFFASSPYTLNANAKFIYSLDVNDDDYVDAAFTE